MALELGGILKAMDATQSFPPSSPSKPPPIHKLFSRMEFIRGGSGVNAQLLEEADIAEAGQYFDEDETETRSMTKEQQQGGWLDSDDIEEFD